MSIEVKFRRGTSAEHSSFTGANGEITIDTTIKTLRVHDGVTVGGTRLAKYSDLGSAANLENVSTNIIPSANVTYDLGTAELAWRDLYLSGNTIYIEGNKISTTGNTVIFQGQNGEPVRLVTDSIKLGDEQTGKVLKVKNGKIATVLANNELIEKTTEFANVSITNLVLGTVLGTQYGGTGLSSFTQNGVLFASNSSVLSFVTGTSGKVMQVGSGGVPEFNDLDGGSFT